MNVTIFPGALKGAPLLPASKSDGIRRLLASALSGEDCFLSCASPCDDLTAAAGALSLLGCRISYDVGGYRITPSDAPARKCADCGGSATLMRFALPVFAACGIGCKFDGDASLRARPIADEIRLLRTHGVTSDKDSPPLTIGGRLLPGEYIVDATISSQTVSGLLFALPLLPGDSTVRLTRSPVSAPYIALTLSVLREYGIVIDEDDSSYVFRITGGQAYHTPEHSSVEADWSSAAFWKCAAYLTESRLTLHGLREDSHQADAAVDRILAKIEPSIDLTDTPDLFPLLAVTCGLQQGSTVLKGIDRLRYKESDRPAAVKELLLRLGCRIEMITDGWRIFGISGDSDPIVVDGHGDHRIVMAAALAGIAGKAPVTVSDGEAAAKSYPGFWDQLADCGAKLIFDK